jgi:hypothetical protein
MPAEVYQPSTRTSSDQEALRFISRTLRQASELFCPFFMSCGMVAESEDAFGSPVEKPPQVDTSASHRSSALRALTRPYATLATLSRFGTLSSDRVS